jgi:ribosome maturation factor RimP
MITKERIEQLVGEKLTSEMFIVEVNVGAGNAISVTVDSFSGLSIDKCVEISRHIEHNFDREVEDFSLEVSSPGLTQPYKVLNQYKKNIGQEVEVVTRDGEKLNGILNQAGENGFTVEAKIKTKVDGKKIDETKPVSFSFEQIKTVKSVITFK